eukprot:CAMPEP_0180834218 /NCGR_PEP_ID=MMETSP1038_2-20121128/77746_1 /TAXON_ID=632150 /ORGANISM="Azadinium spinosum, Strain 3D9" /LENGTH=53 /DNA_ID=CAMNT_0022877451 /DNA_START=466 /DNA_END=627 /DNA_ORIENTATION=-
MDLSQRSSSGRKMGDTWSLPAVAKKHFKAMCQSSEIQSGSQPCTACAKTAEIE